MKNILLLFCCLLGFTFSLHAQWERVLDAEGGQINALARTPDGRLWAGTPTGLFQSSDEGTTWTRNTSVAPTWNVAATRVINGDLYVLAAQPMGDNTSRIVLHIIFANGLWHSQVVGLSQYMSFSNASVFVANNFIYVQVEHLMFRRAFNATTWTPVTVAGFQISSATGEGNIVAALSAQTPSRLYMQISGTNWQLIAPPGAVITESVTATFVRGTRILAAYENGDLFVSNNSGSTWTKTKLPFGIFYTQIRFRWDESLDRLTVSLHNSLHTSPDGGLTWQSAGNVPLNELADFLPEGDRTSVGTKGGFWQRSTPAAPFLRKNMGLRAAPVVDVKTFGNEMFAVFSTSVFRSSDGGSTWSPLDIPLLAAADFREILDFERSGSRLYLLTNKGLMMSEDFGTTWPTAYNSTLAGTSLQLGAAGELWMTTYDENITVVSINDPSQVIRTFSRLLNPGTNDYFNTFHYDPWDGNILAYLAENGNIYASANKGKDWVLRSNLPGIQHLAGKFYQASGTAGRLFFLTGNAIFYSENHGVTWTRATSPSSTGNFTEMVESNGMLFATTTFEGILRSVNNGLSWNFVFNNVTDINLIGLSAVSNTAGGNARLLVGSASRGVWRYENTTLNPFKLVSGSTFVCPGQAQTYCVAALPLAYKYTWAGPTSSGINGPSENPVVLDGDTGHCAEIFFGANSGTSAISVTYDGDAWPVPVTLGFVVSIKAIPPTTLPTLLIAYEDLPYTWPLNGSTVSPNPGTTQTLSVTLQSFKGCDSIVRQGITVKPPVVGTVLGSVFWDNNQNGSYNASTDTWAAGSIVRSSSGLLTAVGADGKYKLTGVQPGDTIWAVPPTPDAVAMPSFVVYQSTNWNIGFRFLKVSAMPDLTIDVTNQTVFRSGFETKITLTCRNIGLQTAQNVQVSLMLPAFLEILGAMPAFTSHIGDVLTWDVGALPFYQSRTIMLTIKTPANIPLNTPVLLTATVLPTLGDANVQNNTDRESTWVRNAYDPNDKQVSPAYATPAMLANGDPFRYTIRFQNTGNFPADFVRITDTLGGTVDPASFRFISSSHPCTWKMLGKGVVEFFFENIQLPDSTSDEPGSHGFVKFAVKPRVGLPLGTQVENTADIFFDFNPAVRTNTAQTRVVYFLPGEEPTGDDLSLRPNPAAFRAFCSWENPLQERGLLHLYDLNGLPVYEMSVEIGDTEANVDVQALPAGAYLAVLEAGSVFLVKTLIVMPFGGLGPRGE